MDGRWEGDDDMDRAWLNYAMQGEWWRWKVVGFLVSHERTEEEFIEA